ncbi:MAG: hypothetical protein ABF917_09265, partial [Gluconobacter oxydans]
MSTSPAPSPASPDGSSGRFQDRSRVLRQRMNRFQARLFPHAPSNLRTLVRGNEIWLSVLAGFVGLLSGLCVFVVTHLTFFMHRLLFGVSGMSGGHLSGLTTLPPLRTVTVLTGGGLAIGLFGVMVAKIMPRSPVDPIEANALHGGRMSVRDSLVIVCQTVLS